MIGFWFVIAAYLAFAWALVMVYPKHLRQTILDVPEGGSDSAVGTLALLLAIGVIVSVISLFHSAI